MDPSLFEEWLKEKKSISDSTIHCYKHSIERFLSENPNLENLEDYNNFLIKLTIKKRCPHYYSVLKGFIEFKITDSNLKKKLIDGLIHPTERNDIVRERKHLTENKIFDVINQLEEEKHRIIALIQSLTGVRVGDIMKLKRGGIVSEIYNNKEVTRLNLIGKRKKRNVIYIHDFVAQTLIWDYVLTHHGHNDYYFLNLGKVMHRPGQMDNEDGLMRMNYLWFWADLKQALQTVGIDKNDFATHDFRRCFARRAWEKYKDIHVLQSLLNHSDPKVTLRYLDQSGLQNIDYHKEMQS